jgi:hypothetical protein
MMMNEIVVALAFIIGVVFGYAASLVQEYFAKKREVVPKRLKKTDLVKDMQDRMHDRLNEIDVPFGRSRKTVQAPVTAVNNARARTMLINKKEKE